MKVTVFSAAMAAAAVMAAMAAGVTAQDVTKFTDRRDGKTYKKVTIGKQVWMAENLNYDVPDVKTDGCYKNKADNCAKYGRLYEWFTAMDGSPSSLSISIQGACPAGWHLPDKDEWEALFDYAGGESTAGTKLKLQTDWNGCSETPAGFKPNTKTDWKSGTDNYGFSALPGGFGGNHGGFAGAGSFGKWWSATDDDAYGAFGYYMSCSNEAVLGSIGRKGDLFSVRCVQD